MEEVDRMLETFLKPQTYFEKHMLAIKIVESFQNLHNSSVTEDDTSNLGKRIEVFSKFLKIFKKDYLNTVKWDDDKQLIAYVQTSDVVMEDDRTSQSMDVEQEVSQISILDDNKENDETLSLINAMIDKLNFQ
jgi:hypothetical protein